MAQPVHARGAPVVPGRVAVQIHQDQRTDVAPVQRRLLQRIQPSKQSQRNRWRRRAVDPQLRQRCASNAVRAAPDVVRALGDMKKWYLQVLFLLAVPAGTTLAQVSFSNQLYPVLEKAGCRNCHNPEGVASATRLWFPEEGAPKERVEAFGRSLVAVVDRKAPERSLLALKPVNRISHTGG